MAPREPVPQAADIAVDETAAQLGLVSLTPKDAIAAEAGASAKSLFDKATTSAAAADRTAAAGQLCDEIAKHGPHALDAFDLFASVKAALADKKNPIAREGALGLIATIAARADLKAAEPFLVPLLSTVLELLADKAKPVTLAAAEASLAITSNMNASATKMVLPMLYNAMDYSQKWQVKQGALICLGKVSISPNRLDLALDFEY